MASGPPDRERLDSWKAIAGYLHRDLATVRRWEKRLGLPVHRVAGSGHSVFAYPAEIDEWLRRAEPAEAPPPRSRRWIGIGIAALSLAVIVFLIARERPVAATDLRIELTESGVVARDVAGGERWRYLFRSANAVPARDPVLVTGGRDAAVYVATSHSGTQKEDRVESGALRRFDAQGRLRHSFSFDDQISVAGKSFTAPWALTSFAVEGGAGHRIAVAAHHYTWDPGLVTILDAGWRRRGTFVHAGWIEVVRWIAPDRLVIGGFSNAHDGGMVALLDPDRLDGQGPEPAGSPHHCDNCGGIAALRMLVFPRSELNRASGSRFNRVIVQTWPDRLLIQTIEASSDNGDATAVYELTPSLDLVTASFNDRYWEMHRVLEAVGTLDHARDHCVDRDGPRDFQRWEPATGWRTAAVRQSRP